MHAKLKAIFLKCQCINRCLICNFNYFAHSLILFINCSPVASMLVSLEYLKDPHNFKQEK